MTAAQFFAAFVAAVVIGLTLTVLSWRAEQYLRNRYRDAGVPFDDDELAAIVDAEEAQVDSWLRLARVVGVLDPGTPIYDRLVCDQIEEQEGWAS